jgi:hypothetical protein
MHTRNPVSCALCIQCLVGAESSDLSIWRFKMLEAGYRQKTQIVQSTFMACDFHGYLACKFHSDARFFSVEDGLYRSGNPTSRGSTKMFQLFGSMAGRRLL